MKPETHIPLHPDDPNQFVMVSSRDGQVTDNFSYAELYNPKTGLAGHPISLQVVEAVQFIRSVTGIPMNANSTYRNYIPSSGVNPASRSPHMLACAFDSSFLADGPTNEALYIAIREDFDNKGPLFQYLWDMGVRGFGSYDTFIHLDTLASEYYSFARTKRTSVHKGQRYARWNNMKELMYLRPSLKFVEQHGTIALVEVGEEEPAIVRTVKSVAGIVKGSLNELFDNDDQGRDFTARQGVYIVGTLLLLAILGLSFSKQD